MKIYESGANKTDWVQWNKINYTKLKETSPVAEIIIELLVFETKVSSIVKLLGKMKKHRADTQDKWKWKH